MGGHATHDEREAREMIPPEVFAYWGKRDPIGTYESYLQRHGVPQAAIEEVERQVTAEIAIAEKEALNSSQHDMPKPEMTIRGVYAGQDEAPPEKSSRRAPPKADSTRKTPSR